MAQLQSTSSKSNPLVSALLVLWRQLLTCVVTLYTPNKICYTQPKKTECRKYVSKDVVANYVYNSPNIKILLLNGCCQL